MKTLIIPDIHNKHLRAQTIIDRHSVDQVVLLGDYFDDYGDSPEDVLQTAIWLKGMLAQPNVTVLWGNHDQHYLLTPLHHERWICSGYDPLKRKAISHVLTADDAAKLQMAVEADGWLLTHAGFDHRQTGGDEDNGLIVDAALAKLAMLAGVHPIPLLAIPRSRGGYAEVGGLTWQDWREHRPIPGQRQLFGHTQDVAPRYRDGSICIDTNLHHYAIITDGAIQVKEGGR